MGSQTFGFESLNELETNFTHNLKIHAITYEPSRVKFEMKYRPRLYELRPITKQVLKVELLKARKRKQSGHTGNI
jgi:hypothetical protein